MGADVASDAPVVPCPRAESPSSLAGTTHRSDVFSPGRLRAHRDLARLTREQLATLTGLPVAVIIAYERGTRAPTDTDLAVLAEALTVGPDALTGAPGADDSFEYWELICAAMPPMTSEQLASVVTILRRIDQRRSEQPEPPR